jgi:hypothetical protein
MLAVIKQYKFWAGAAVFLATLSTAIINANSGGYAWLTVVAGVLAGISGAITAALPYFENILEQKTEAAVKAALANKGDA